MANKKKRVDPIKQREKRAKIAAGIGVVLFLALAAYEVPSMMKVLNKKPPAGANATDAGNRNADGSIPHANVAANAPATGLTGKGELADTDVPPAASSTGQLVSFSVFETKNPFAPQVSSAPAATTAAAPTTANKPGADVTGTSTTATPSPTTSATTTPSTTTPTTTPLTPPATTAPTSTTPTPATGPTVAISVNGTVSRVGTGGTFPTGAPVFRLASWQQGTAQIAIVGGSYATGGQTLPLRLNQPVTLQNTHDGKQYKLVLISTP
jgi:hypothetical protein